MNSRKIMILPLWLVLLGVLGGCNNYKVRFIYPHENRGDFFTEMPQRSLYVAEPEDLRPNRERNGAGIFNTLHFPSDKSYSLPPTLLLRRALLQDLGQTRVATLVQNPDLADYILSTQLLSMSTRLGRPAGAWAIPVATGAVVSFAATASSDGAGGTSDAIKMGLVGAFLGTLLPAPADLKATVEMHMQLRDRETNELVWSTTCTGEYRRNTHISLSGRNDKKYAEKALPLAMKRANACAVGQLFAFLQQSEEESK